MLPQHIGPARLIAAGEAHEAAPARQMVDHRGFLGHPDRIVGGEHVAQDTNVDILGHRRPVRLDRTRRGRNFIPLGPEMVFDRPGAPDAHLIRGLDDVGRAVNGGMVQVPIPADRAQRRALGFVLRGHDRIDDGHGFQLCHLTISLLVGRFIYQSVESVNGDGRRAMRRTCRGPADAVMS